MRNPEVFKLETQTLPNLMRWIGEIAARPAVQRAERAMADIMTKDRASLTTAQPERMDRVFGRGRYAKV
jgi:hypothetical protein